MKISGADIQLASQHNQRREHRIVERLTISETAKAAETFNADQARPPETSNTANETRLIFQSTTPLTLDTQNNSVLYAPSAPGRIPEAHNMEEAAPTYTDLFTMLVEAFIGKKIEIHQLNLNAPASIDLSAEFTLAANESSAQQEQAAPRFDYYRHELIIESETTSFSALGTITTKDGREISLDLQQSMHYQYRFEEEINLSNQILVDPLIINLANNTATLTEHSYNFDLDANGSEEQIYFAGGGSAFLALDKNTDGQINNGGELFGAITGNGFAELAVYDDDDNGFIDEGDSIFQQLRLYNKSAEGEDQLSTLQEAGVGAFYLGYSSTPFSIKNENNELLAAVRASGIYISEEGESGTIQQVDLAV